MILRLDVIKGLVLGGLFLLTFLFSMLPMKIYSFATHVHNDKDHPDRKHKWSQKISLISCYAAGVFLATCLLDLLPDVRDKMNSVFDILQINTSFPITEFVMVFGLIFILLIEQITLTYKERSEEVSQPLLESPKHRRFKRQLSRRSSLESSYGGISDQPISKSINSIRTLTDENFPDYETFPPADTNSIGSQHSLEYSIEYQAEHSMHVDQSSHSKIRSMMLLLALSLHSVFEGLAVGLQPKADMVLKIFVALLIHKSILAFSLGINLVQSRLTNCMIIGSNLIFSFTSPFGIALGILITDISHSPYTGLANGVLQGIACGTFLYITFFEVLPHEFNNNENRILKVLCLILGYSTIVGIMFLDPDTALPRCAVPGPATGTPSTTPKY